MNKLFIVALVVAFAPGAVANAAIVGACKFDTVHLSFAGDALAQAQCLMRTPKKWGRLDSGPATVPDVLASRIGKTVVITQQTLRAHLAHTGLTEAMVGGPMDSPVSRARNNDPTAPLARYFVIHDTSSPYLGNDPFPTDIDTSPRINQLSRWAGSNAVAHIFINRKGELLVGHDFAIPWRATKLENKVVGELSKGLFLHVENVQPRRRDPAGGPKNDAIAPTPGFSDPQYTRLALLYVAASVRAGTWLIPAMHAALDEGLNDAHDDPQNFDLVGKFTAALSELITQLETN